MRDTISLIIATTDVPTKCIGIIRKFNPVSLGEIKKCISSHLPILEYDAIDHDGLDNLLSCYSELAAIEIPMIILDGGEPSSLELMKNLQRSYKETEIEVSRLMEEETT